MFIFLYLTIYHTLLHKEIPIVNNVSLSMLCFEMKTNPQKKHMINIWPRMAKSDTFNVLTQT